MKMYIQQLQQVPWSSLAHGIDEGFTNSLYAYDYQKATIFDVAHAALSLLKLQQSFCSSGITIVKPLAYGLIAINVLHFFSADYSFLIHEPWREDPGMWLHERIMHISDCVWAKTSTILRITHILDGFLQLQNNQSQAIAKLATINAVFLLSQLKDKLVVTNFCVNVLIRAHVKAYATYQSCYAANYIATFKKVYDLARRGNFISLLQLDYTKAVEGLKHVYQCAKTVSLVDAS